MKVSRRDFLEVVAATTIGTIIYPGFPVFSEILPEQRLLEPFNANIRKRQGVWSYYKKGKEKEIVTEHIRLLKEWAKDYIPRRYMKKVKFKSSLTDWNARVATILDYNPINS